MRTVLLLLLIITLLFGWQRMLWTVTPASGSFPLAGARFTNGVAGAFPGLPVYCAAERMPQKLLSDLQFAPGVLPDIQYPRIWLLGSGLQHHYALPALKEVNHLVDFDAHTDMRSGDSIDCGNWLRHWLAGSSNRDAIIIGVSDMLGGETWVNGNAEYQPLSLLTEGRAQLWPVHGRQSFFHEPLTFPVRNPSVAAFGGGIHESYLKWRTIEEIQLPRKQKLAVTVDLDCLDERGFASEWRTGELPLPTLLALLRDLAQSNLVESISICGFGERQSDSQRAALVSVVRAVVRAAENRP